MKTCTKCGEEKSEEEFHWKVKGERRRAYCKVCNLETARKWHQENRERKQQHTLKWRAKNLDKVRAQNRNYSLRYKRLNPQVIATQRALKDSKLTDTELFCGLSRTKVNAEVRFDYILRDLLTEKTGIQHHVDHIKPLCEGGVHRMWNLSVISAEANLKKGPVWFLEDHLTDADIEAQDAEIRAIS